MKLLIACDMEGITGVTRWEHVTPGEPEYERFRRIMTEDVNSVIEGAFEGGAEEIIVADGHHKGQNILIEDLNQRVYHNNGTFSPWSMMNGISDGIDAVIFVGYHAKAGTANAILAHTWQKNVLDVRINGSSVGEFGLNSLLAGSFDVPVLMATGDQTLAEEAMAFIPGIIYTQVKKSTGYYSGSCLPPAMTKEMLSRDAETAVQNFLQGKAPTPVKLTAPIYLEVDFSMPEYAEAANRIPGTDRKSGRGIGYHCKDIQELYTAFRAITGLGS